MGGKIVMTSKNIYQRINEVMKEVEYVQKDAVVQGYKAVTHDQVTAALRKSMVKNGIICVPSLVSSEVIQNKDPSNGIKMMHLSHVYNVAFINIDSPEDRLEAQVEAHAQDSGDKSPGKAMSYAVKCVMLKVFSLETGENDESRAAENNLYSDEQQEEYFELIESGNELDFLDFLKLVGPEVQSELYNSFPKGKISSGKKAAAALEQAAYHTLDNIYDEVTALCDKRDPAATEHVEELSAFQKRYIWGKLSQDSKNYLKSLRDSQ
jgi:hypothetical protein